MRPLVRIAGATGIVWGRPITSGGSRPRSGHFYFGIDILLNDRGETSSDEFPGSGGQRVWPAGGMSVELGDRVGVVLPTTAWACPDVETKKLQADYGRWQWVPGISDFQYFTVRGIMLAQSTL